MLLKEVKYSYSDVSIIPAVKSEIEHRSECNPYDHNGMLPIFTAPMSSIVDYDNMFTFLDNNVYPILPRTVDITKRLINSGNGSWSAFSLKEFNDHFLEKSDVMSKSSTSVKVLIDIANGHMESMMRSVRKAKDLYDGNLQIMVGNIANPETYKCINKSGADYVRLGIGGGLGCITSTNLGVHYPQASLIDETKRIKDQISGTTKLIADGGIRNFSDVNKAIALGADYVMIGGLFSNCLESCGEKRAHIESESGSWDIIMTSEDKETYKKNGYILNGNVKYFPTYITSKFYGMASRDGQKDLYGKKIRTSEGRTSVVKVKYTLPAWIENMTDYLRSAMSYAGARTLTEFRENTNLTVMSPGEQGAINK